MTTKQTPRQAQIAADLDTLTTLIENGLDLNARDTAVTLAGGAVVHVKHLTESFYSVMPMEGFIRRTGVGVHVHPKTGRLDPEVGPHHLKVVIRRAYRCAAAHARWVGEQG